jgi:hypothetical protein
LAIESRSGQQGLHPSGLQSDGTQAARERRLPDIQPPARAQLDLSEAPAGRLRLICLFHLNLAFSSLEEDAQIEVVRRCYRPALELVRETGFPIAVEATGWTLRRIAELDPGWIELARELIDEGRVELIGSAHAQCAAPLLPAEVNAWNLRLGRETYLKLLGVAPRIALVCEQVFSPGLVGLYLDAGYEAIVVDWDNAHLAHPEWPSEYRHAPQRAIGCGCSIPILWSQSIAFQKFQRLAHEELPLNRYVDYVREVAASVRESDSLRRGALMLYANDVEIFDHRPGRFVAEPELREGEWERIAEALGMLRESHVGTAALPCELFELLAEPGAGYELALEAPGWPISVKKQDKYNVTRWAVTGRDDISINTRCWRLYARLRSERCADPERWRELCELWASDFRTHITESRWTAFLADLADAERRWPGESGEPLPGAGDGWAPAGAGALGPGKGSGSLGLGEGSASRCDSYPTAAGPLVSGGLEPPAGMVRHDGSFLELRSEGLTLRLNTRRGLAIDALSDASVCDRPLLGTLEHGYFPTIELGADFYSGHLVQESPLTHKVTDLERTAPKVNLDGEGRLCAHARIETELGPIDKSIRLNAAERAVDIEWVLRWRELPLGSLRLGHVTLLPEAFDASTLWYATHNGGTELETHRIAGPGFDHGAAVSALVSCRQGLGVTEGVVLLGDAERTIRVEVDQECARPLGLISWMGGAERWFLRLCFALTESDETRRGPISRDPAAPQRMRMRIRAERGAG